MRRQQTTGEKIFKTDDHDSPKFTLAKQPANCSKKKKYCLNQTIKAKFKFFDHPEGRCL